MFGTAMMKAETSVFDEKQNRNQAQLEGTKCLTIN
jgi:hypothetical protein